METTLKQLRFLDKLFRIRCNVPRGSILPAAGVLLDAYDIEDGDLLPRKEYTADYLSQGYMNLSQYPMTMFKLKDLIDHGLLKLEPGLEPLSVQRQLASRVSEVRVLFDQKRPEYQRETLTSRKQGILQSIAFNCCSTPTMRLVLMAVLMSFHPRKKKDENILRILCDPGLSKSRFW